MQTRREFLVGVATAAVANSVGGLRAATYDVLIKGGRVIDPAASVDRVMDVAIASGRAGGTRQSFALECPPERVCRARETQACHPGRALGRQGRAAGSLPVGTGAVALVVLES